LKNGYIYFLLLLNFETCILIENSAFYFRIKNCTLYNSGLGNYTNNEYEAGIKLINTRNVKIINNNCSGNNGVGIMLSDGCIYNTISRNNVSNNGQHGILLYNDCHNNLLLRNNISVNDFCGINLIKNCNYNSISENNISENDSGIMIFDGCLENAFLDNRVENINKSGVIVKYHCNYNNFSRNIIQNSGECGINITLNCSNNLVYNNSFSRNLKTKVRD